MRKTVLAVLLASLVSGAGACSGSSKGGGPDARQGFPADAMPADAEAGLQTEFGGARPATLSVPTSYDASTPMPLVILLHGFTTSPDYVTPLFKFTGWFEQAGFLVIAPHGLVDADGNFYWNATDACCDLFNTGTDDSAYLAGIIDEIAAVYNVDPKRVYIFGHSNGAFMAYRMACDHADKIAAIISLAGATYSDTTACTPSEPVSVVQLHGDADMTIQYDGGVTTQSDNSEIAFPSATTSVATWAAYNGCDAQTAAGTALDLTTNAGDDTNVLQHTGCPTGVDAELWTMPGITHIVTNFNDTTRDVFWAWLQAHAKP